MSIIWLCLTLCSAPAEPPVVVTAETVAQLAVALADDKTDIVSLKMPADALLKPQLDRLKKWVEWGGTAWVSTDAAAWFGFEVATPTPPERLAIGRRACPLGASALAAQADRVMARLAPDEVLLVAHPTALPLLQVLDPVVGGRRKVLAAELYWGDGRVIFRPATVLDQADGPAWRAAVEQTCHRLVDDAAVPIETLTIARGRLAEARELLKRKPDEAKAKAAQVFQAYRLWYADYLTYRRRFDEAAQLLAGIARELPEDPAVYLAVARLNEGLGRELPAQEARRKAKERYEALELDPPRPDARQVRVPWPLFAGSVNAMGKAWEKPSEASLAEAMARTDLLLALDHYRRQRMEPVTTLLKEAAELQPGWPLPLWQLGLLEAGLGENLKLANRERVTHFDQAAKWFEPAAKATPRAEFPAELVAAAEAWRLKAVAESARLRAEPPDVLLRSGVILRYNGADRRLQVGPLKESLAQAFAAAYDQTTRWGVWADDLEVLVYDDGFRMRAALPETGVVPQAFAAAATAGRRVYTIAQSDDIGRIARHQVAHAVINAVTESGLPGPLWFQEGLASATQGVPTNSQRARVSLRRGQALSIQQLNEPGFFYDRNNVDQAWGQSELMLNAYAARFGADAVLRLLRETGWGKTADAAFRAITDMTQDQFLSAFLQGRLGG